MTGNRTYHTRYHCEESTSATLSKYASLMSKVERKLFSETASGKRAKDLKKEYLKRFQITARQFNSCRIQLEGKIASIKERVTLHISNLNDRIKSLNRWINHRKKKREKAFLRHQKKRKLSHLQNRLEALKKDQQNKTIRLCFGSKRLYREQFNLKENGYATHEQWKKKWQDKRDQEFFLVGSKDETGGNQTCTPILNEDGSLNLRLRLPDALNAGKYLYITNLNFKYGKEHILNALKNQQAITFRFKKDDKGWLIFVTVTVEAAPRKTLSGNGAIGVDINANHLALVETDRFGNPLTKKTIPLITYGKTQEQAKANIGDACAQVIAIAEKAKKPLAVEKLDFQKKKIALKEKGSKRYARMLCSFSYQKILTNLESRAHDHGIEINQVNPAYSSLIGRIKFSKRYGLSIHHAAALVISRRISKFSERPPQSLDAIPDGKGDYVALALPVRNRAKHVWSYWGEVNGKLKAALAERFRAARRRSTDPPQVDVCDKKVSETAGGIPARESLATLFG